MPTRRALLALLATAPFAGCGDAASNRTDESPLAGRTVHVGGDVSLPADSGATRVATVADAEIVVLPPSGDRYDTALSALERGTPVVVAGDDAPGYVQRVCDRTGRGYGLPGEGWTPDERVAGIVPAPNRLGVQYFEPRRDADLPDALGWAVGELLDGTPPVVPIADPPSPDDGVRLGWTRVRGRVDVGDYDQWERATLLPERPAAVVETVATIDTVDASPWDQYRVAEVAVESGFSDAAVESTGSASATDGVSATTDRAESDVTYAFAPERERRSLTVGTRTVVSLPERPSSFASLGNVRFGWRRGRLLREDESWVAHTPGRTVWRDGDSPTG